MVYVFYLLVCFFALYGILSMIMTFSDLISARESPSGGKTRLLLLVKDCEDSIESVARGLYNGGRPGKVPGGCITIIDMNSCDGTPDILRRLQRQYDGIEVINKEQLSDIYLLFERQL